VQAEVNNRASLCSQGTVPGYMNCLDCKEYKADGQAPLKEGVDETLWTCDYKLLNLAEWMSLASI
jgi:hypothetical protein